MPVTEKTRKVLWGRSGNRCAICRVALTVEPTALDVVSVVGEECHIVSGHAGGPRYELDFQTALLDEPDNLILLCRVHHKMVDDQGKTYTAGVLGRLKANHERWVTQSLEEPASLPPVRIRRIKASVPEHLVRLRTGAEIMRLNRGTFAASHENDELANEAEAELIGSFFQEVQDWGDLLDETEIGEHVRAEFRLSEAIKDLEQAGFWLFGAREVQQVEGGIGPPSPWPVLHLCVLREDNPRIQLVRS